MKKVLNLYAGLGGNRRLWKNVSVTAVEKSDKIAKAYKNQFPDDEVIVDDAHQYLIDHHNEYDFIWSSPPCQKHTKMVKATRHKVQGYIDMSLYQEIIFLKHFYKGAWIVENVKPYYKPLVRPSIEIGRHLFWSNFIINPMANYPKFTNLIGSGTLKDAEALKKWLGIEYEGSIYYENNHCPCQVLRNCVHPELGLHVFNHASKSIELELW